MLVVSLGMKPVTVLFAIVVFLSAFLLFLVEPMAAKELLPVLGGSAAVWTTCLVFFQVALLAGYGYAHLLVSLRRPRVEFGIHLGVLAAALVLLAWHVRSADATAQRHPMIAIFSTLTLRIGLPFSALASTGPLLQAWWAGAESERHRPPWRLFALSNFGSLLALAAYPALVEPRLTLQAQRHAWLAGFSVFAALCAGCAYYSLISANGTKRHDPSGDEKARSSPPAPVPVFRMLLWALLPACSSMMLCAVTNHLSQNIAAIPLLWILPLLAYLLSFIVTFSGPVAYPRFLGICQHAFAVGIVGYILYNPRVTFPLQLSIPVFALSLFLMCFFCHGELYRLRPDARWSTTFYLLISLGSAVGALYVGVVAPLVFSADYDLITALSLACVLALAVTWDRGVATRFFWLAATSAMAWVAFVQVRDLGENALVQERSFYGSLRVTQTQWPPDTGPARILYHGTIEHGSQLFGGDLRKTPTSYYASDSGAGLALRFCCASHPRNIGVVGLGTGTLAAYGEPGDSFTFFEINPIVERLARAFFTYLRESQAQVNIVQGDARLSLAREEARGNVPRYDVLVLDAFSGDAVPVHLLTAEAINLYRRRLKPGGVLAFHVSSQYLNLAPLLAAQADRAGMQVVMIRSSENEARGEFASDWVLMTADPRFLDQPEVFNASQSIQRRAGLKAWTDDFNSLLPIVRWERPRPRRTPAPPND
jgi:spermidine synthase